MQEISNTTSHMNRTIALQIKGLTKQYGDLTAVDHTSFETFKAYRSWFCWWHQHSSASRWISFSDSDTYNINCIRLRLPGFSMDHADHFEFYYVFTDCL